MNIAKLRQACTLPNICRLFALLMVAWQPFPGEHRVPLVGSALLGLAICRRGELPEIGAPAKRLAVLLLCLVIPGLLSIPTSLAPGKSWSAIASVALVGLAGVCVLYGLRRREDHQWQQKGLVVVIAAWIGDGLFQAFTGADIFGYVPKAEGMINGPFETNGIFGIIVAMLNPIGALGAPETTLPLGAGLLGWLDCDGNPYRSAQQSAPIGAGINDPLDPLEQTDKTGWDCGLYGSRGYHLSIRAHTATEGGLDEYFRRGNRHILAAAAGEP